MDYLKTLKPWAVFGLQLGVVNVALTTMICAALMFAGYELQVKDYLLDYANDTIGIALRGSTMYLVYVIDALLLTTSVAYWAGTGALREFVTKKYTRKYGQILDLVINATIVSAVVAVATSWTRMGLWDVVYLLVVGTILGYASVWIALKWFFPPMGWKPPRM